MLKGRSSLKAGTVPRLQLNTKEIRLERDPFFIAKTSCNTVNQPKNCVSEVSSNKIVWQQKISKNSALFRVELLKDMRLDIFFGDKQIFVPSLQRVKHVDEMSEVLLKVSSLLPCCGLRVPNKLYDRKCKGYVWKKWDDLDELEIPRCLPCMENRNRSKGSVSKKKKDFTKIIRRKSTTKLLMSTIKHNKKLREKILNLELTLMDLQEKYDMKKMNDARESEAVLPVRRRATPKVRKCMVALSKRLSHP